MLSTAKRHLLIVGLLLAAVTITWGQRWRGRAAADLPVAPSPAQEAGYTYFCDVEGWYRITPYETVVRSGYDLSAATTASMAQALPPVLGEWQQMGEDEDIGDDPAVVFYLNQPTISLQRTYQDGAGQRLTLTIVGNVGEDSFLLFSHTPETCYPGRLWQIVDSRLESANLDDRPMYAQYLLTEHADTGDRLMVLYWYLWDNPQRDSRDGVLSMRVNLFLAPGESQEAALARAWGFVRLLFPATLAWDRF